MQVRPRHTPSAGVARLVLGSAEVAQAEAGAMMASSYDIAVETKASSGPAGPLVSTFVAPRHGGWVDVAPGLPGEVYAIELDGQSGWCVAKSGWLASAGSVWWDFHSGGLGDLFGGQAGFLGHATGHGPVVVCCYGAMDILVLQPGEYVTVDAGYVVAYSDEMQCRLRYSGHSAATSPHTGEGLVFDFAGPGQVIAQTRNPRALVSWLRVLANDADF